MVKRNLVNRVAAGALATIVAMTSSLTGVGGMTAQAASSYSFQAENLLVNPDFESDTAFDAANGNSHAGNWYSYQESSKETEVTHAGNGAAKFTAGQSSLEQDVPAEDLVVGMTYVYSVWAKLSEEVSESSTNYSVGVKNYGGSEIKQYVTTTEWKQYEIEFVYTGGDARVFGWVEAQENSAVMYIDDASLIAKSAISAASIENGQINVTFAESLETAPLVDDFTASCRIGADSETASVLKLVTEKWNEKNNTLTLTFDPIEKLPGTEQVVYVSFSYKGEASVELDFTVEAGEGEAVTAQIDSVTAENGKVTVVLDQDPTVAPAASQFTWEYKLDGDDFKTLSVSDFAYDSAAKTITVNTQNLRDSQDHNIHVRVTYGDSVKEAYFEVKASESTTYYVDSTNGNDENDGTTEATAFASIDQLNTITFLPGDEILFKRGETFEGCFKPQGSGTKEAPIKIGVYGDENADRPKLQPGEDWTISHIMSADTTVENPKVNYVIQFYNVQYWEVSGLEIVDPTPQTINDATATYCSGITIQAEEIGTLEHFYIDNVIIHGFHGPGTNIGKTSGGITMNVITNKDWDRSIAVPTQINDIRITNCEIYDVGRSGINFLTPWAYRTDEKWAGSYWTGRSSYEWMPYTDFYLGNNYIHDIDGDGCIIDNCKNAVVENNLVTQCVQNLHSSARMAVGLFNWNSDDTYFQYNEVYDIQIGGDQVCNDGQGIEIDALNDRTYVQYNYVHDNRGGFMMYCNVGEGYKGFEGIVRYNISQNDYAHPRQGLMDIYADNYDGAIYNNTFYLTERVLKSGSDEIFLFATAQSAGQNNMKFYNNIFYYDGETPAAANMFGDDYIDWQSNIFYGFTNLPENDNPSAPNISIDPKLADPGKGGTGSYTNGQITKVDLSCYKLLKDSPAINAGVPVGDETNTRDYFGNPVTGIPDIGAYESGSVLLKLVSINADIVTDQDAMTITVTDTAKVTARTLLENLIYEEGVMVKVKRGNAVLEGGIRLAEGDVVTGTYEGKTISYTVEVKEGNTEVSDVIPTAHMNASAGTEETSSENGAAANVLDGNTSTIWHSNYSGTAPTAEEKYLTLEIKDGYEYEITGYIYTPRSGAGNGTITAYEIYTSDDNTNWTKAAEDTWNSDAAVKTVVFSSPVKARYVKLLAVESVGGFVSAAEVRLTGTGGLVDTDVPTAPVVSVSEITDTSAEITWTEATDTNGIESYVLYINGESYAVFDPDVTSYTLTGLDASASYTIAVYAVDVTGKTSENVLTTTFITSVSEDKVIRTFGKDRNATSLEVADELKAVLGIDKFDTIIVATGKLPYDALAGSYLANAKKAPILLTNGKEEVNTAMIRYIQENAKADAKVYILGGTSAVSEETETRLASTVGKDNVTRLQGANRLETNLAILNEVGLDGQTELLVATSSTCADSLSASATGKPILLVNGKGLTEKQKEVVSKFTNGTIYILGGTSAVSEATVAELKNTAKSGQIGRLEGANRYETSVKIAQEFFKDSKKAVIAYGKDANAADGLCGGALAAALHAPLILTREGDQTAATYTKTNGMKSGYVLGGKGLVTDELAKAIFSTETILVKEQ